MRGFWNWTVKFWIAFGLLVVGGCSMAIGLAGDEVTITWLGAVFDLGPTLESAQRVQFWALMAGAVLGGFGAMASGWQLFFAPKPLDSDSMARLMGEVLGVSLKPGTQALSTGDVQARPANVLIARFRVMPFEDVAGFKAMLLAWALAKRAKRREAHAPVRDVTARLVAAGGGYGKTRLALELLEALEKKGWSGGFLPADATSSDALAGALPKLFAPSKAPIWSREGCRPVGWFVVLDYADARADRLKPVLEALQQVRRSKGPPVRVLLLARSQGEWWTEVKALSAADGILGKADVVQLEDKALTLEQRAKLFASAAQAFAARLKADGVPVDQPTPAVPDLSDGLYDRVLTVAMAAFLAVRGKGSHGPDGLFDALAAEERANWDRCAAPTTDSALLARRKDNIARGAAQLTLLQGASTALLRVLRAADPARPDDPSLEVDTTITALQRLYPGAPPGRTPGAGPVEPDILGEAMVARMAGAEGGPALLLETLRVALADEAGTALATSTLTMLLRALRHPEPRTRDAAQRLVTDIETVLVPVLPDTSVARFNSAVPWPTTAFRRLGAALAARLKAAAPQDLTPEAKAERARALHILGVRDAELGRREDALQATEEAVGLYRDLARSNPDTFNPDLANALKNLGTCYSNLGRRDDALQATEEAVGLFRDLARSNPDAFNPDLARALNNLGAMYSNLSRRDDALQATEEAVGLYRDLARSNPDAFNHDLAVALNNLGIRYSNLGRRDDALQATEEAVAIRRDLARSNPDAFNHDLARSLSVLGDCCRGLGRELDAQAAYEEAVEILKPFVLRYPGALDNLMAATRRDWEACLRAQGWDEAAIAGRAAVLGI